MKSSYLDRNTENIYVVKVMVYEIIIEIMIDIKIILKLVFKKNAEFKWENEEKIRYSKATNNKWQSRIKVSNYLLNIFTKGP